MKKSYQSFVHDLLNSDILVPYFFVDAFDFSTRNFNNLIYSNMRVVRFNDRNSLINNNEVFIKMSFSC
jgi:hypothetical protein